MAERFDFDLPWRRDAGGGMARVSGTNLQAVRVRNVLLTVSNSPVTRGELPYKDDFGSGVSGLRHRANRLSTGAIAERQIADAFEAHLSDLELLAVTPKRDNATSPGQPNLLLLHISFRERRTGKRQATLARLQIGF